jgi:thiosulfate/3-mercaptopyruvate sulfurtransferase
VTVRPRDDLIVDATWVQEHATELGYALVDARSQAVYDGIRETRGRAGHIPGAGATPWGEFVDEEIMLRSAAEIEAVFAGAGVRDGDKVVAYCHIGQYATMALFAARTLGYEVKLYDGAFQDWAQRDLPVER